MANPPAGGSPQKRVGAFGVEELGLTNTATVGPNLVRAMRKADALKLAPAHFGELAAAGFPNLAAELAARADGLKCLCNQPSVPDERRHALWAAAAHVYTKEDFAPGLVCGRGSCTYCQSGEVGGGDRTLYRELNALLRNDAEELSHWASYIMCLFYGGDAQYSASCAPPSALPAAPQTTYRGFGMDPALQRFYPKGRRFYWQAFVSTSKSKAVSVDFALNNCPPGQAPFLFIVEMPEYKQIGDGAFWAYELEEVTALDGEEEVLVPSYTRFEVLDEPKRAPNGCVEIPIRVIAQPLIRALNSITVWVDPNGFEDGDNHNLAQHAFLTGMPRFRRRETPIESQESWGVWKNFEQVPGIMEGLALFTDAGAALRWMGQELRVSQGILFKLLTSGQASQQLFGGFNEHFGSTPFEALVFCGNVPRWTEVWKAAPRIRVTSSVAEVRDYLTHEKYYSGPNGFVPLAAYPVVRDAIAERQTVWYPWRRVDGGVVYGGAGAPSRFVEGDEGWEQGTGSLPDVPMAM